MRTSGSSGSHVFPGVAVAGKPMVSACSLIQWKMDETEKVE
jgi:hypothetical protein